MKNMKSYIIIILSLLFTSCAVNNPSLFNAHSNQFENKYEEFINDKEKIVSAWYNYVTTQNEAGDYILRTFFPETKQITSEVRYKNKQLTIANGSSKYWHENGNLKYEGDYKNNKAEGEWKYYHRKSGHLSSTGNTKSNLKEGIWKIYNENGILSSEVTYLNDIREGKFIEFDSIQNIINKGIYNSDTIYQQTKIDTIQKKYIYGVTEQMPHLSQCASIEDNSTRDKCSSKALIEYIYQSLKYPKNARNYGMEGMTVTQFVIDVDGQVKEIDVVIGLCQEFKDECERVISNMPKWNPGVQQGKKVKVLYTMPIKFQLK